MLTDQYSKKIKLGDKVRFSDSICEVVAITDFRNVVVKINKKEITRYFKIEDITKSIPLELWAILNGIVEMKPLKNEDCYAWANARYLAIINKASVMETE